MGEDNILRSGIVFWLEEEFNKAKGIRLNLVEYFVEIRYVSLRLFTVYFVEIRCVGIRMFTVYFAEIRCVGIRMFTVYFAEIRYIGDLNSMNCLSNCRFPVM